MFGGDILLQLAESVKDNLLNTSGVDDEVQRDSILALCDPGGPGSQSD